MKLFPSSNFSVDISMESSKAMMELKSNTDLTDSLTSSRTNKAFRGQVNRSDFKVISSEIGRGAFCIISGQFENQNGRMKIDIHPVFKVLLTILLFFPTVVICIAIILDRSQIGLLIPLIMHFVFVRFVLIEISFRLISRTAMRKLTDIIGIKNLKKTLPNNT